MEKTGQYLRQNSVGTLRHTSSVEPIGRPPSPPFSTLEFHTRTEEPTMSRSIMLCALALFLLAANSLAAAKSPTVIIQVDQDDCEATRRSQAAVPWQAADGRRGDSARYVELDGRTDQPGQEPVVDDRAAIRQGQEARPDAGAPRGAVRIWQHAPAGLGGLHPPGRAAHRRSRQALGGAVRRSRPTAATSTAAR